MFYKEYIHPRGPELAQKTLPHVFLGPRIRLSRAWLRLVCEGVQGYHQRRNARPRPRQWASSHTARNSSRSGGSEGCPLHERRLGPVPLMNRLVSGEPSSVPWASKNHWVDELHYSHSDLQVVRGITKSIMCHYVSVRLGWCVCVQ